MTRYLVCLVAASSLCGLLPELPRAAADEPAGAASHIPGWVQRDGAWHPDEPFVAGQPRATGLQAPFPRMPSLDKNPQTPAKVELGKLLFFDPLLSGENTISCAHCHHPDHGFADGRKLSMGFGGQGVGPDRSGGHALGRSAPSLWNSAYQKWQFWDGRADDLEAQAAGPMTNEHEMGEKPEELVKELRAIPEYVALFQQAFGGNPEEAVTFPHVTQALAAFERTLLSFRSKFDRYAAGDTTALDEHERSGMKLFRSLKTRCFECHNFPTFADDTFRVIGVPEKDGHDRGRASVPGEGPDGAFKTVGLRNIALTAPYMHNGAFDTLEEVIKFYAKGGGRDQSPPPPGIDDKIGKFDITDAEIADLVAFLKALTDTSLQPDPPARVPSGLPVVTVKTKAQPAALARTQAAPALRATAATGAAAPTAPASAAAAPVRATVPASGGAPLIGYSNGNIERAANQAAGFAAASARPSVRVADARGSSSTVAATFTVRPGQSIQQAVDRCRSGDRVEVEPGVYRQSVVVDTDGVTLAGIEHNGERAVLDGGGELADAVQSSADDFVISGFTIRHYKGNGVLASKARRVTFRDLVLDDAGLYGVYPVECSGVLVERCTVSGASDAAIYVGSSREIVVRDNEVFNNVAGIEIENCTQALVTNNSAHHNSAGLLVFVLPNNPAKVGTDTRVINNRSWANNHENFGKPGTLIANLPTGIGILVMAADRTEVTRNWLAENDSYGVVVTSLDSGSSPIKLDVEPHSDQTTIAGNEYRDNGRHPHRVFTEKRQAPGGDLFWNGSGVGNVWRESSAIVTFPSNLLRGPAAPAAAVRPPADTNTTLDTNSSPTTGGSP